MFGISWVIKKKIPKVITIAGPVAISNSIELKSPNKTDTIETTIEPIIMERGDLEKTRAMAGGIMSNDVIKSTPTICTDTETASAIRNINSNS